MRSSKSFDQCVGGTECCESFESEIHDFEYKLLNFEWRVAKLLICVRKVLPFGSGSPYQILSQHLTVKKVLIHVLGAQNVGKVLMLPVYSSYCCNPLYDAIGKLVHCLWFSSREKKIILAFERTQHNICLSVQL